MGHFKVGDWSFQIYCIYNPNNSNSPFKSHNSLDDERSSIFNTALICDVTGIVLHNGIAIIIAQGLEGRKPL